MLGTGSPIAQEGVGALEADSAIVEAWICLKVINVSGVMSIGSCLFHLTVIQALEARI
jgi:hypothetical protein